MKLAKYLMTMFIGTLVYVLLSVTVGQNSIRSYKHLEEQKRVISKQTVEIQNINNELILELAALKNDNAVIAAYARKLDYVSNDEKLVKITGLKPAQTTLYDTGSIIRHTESGYLSEKYCKIIALFAFVMSFIIFFLFDVSAGNIVFEKNKKTVVTGIPIYDVQQI